MNPTPERALELADFCHDANIHMDEMLAATGEIAAILRAYADLSRKWQSVLDAEEA